MENSYSPVPSAVTVKGVAREGARRQKSVEAVTVVELGRAARQSSDLGEVLARTPGVTVRRSGGLGSGARLAMNGLYDDQVRLFLDGVPLDAAGFPFGVANVPVNLLTRVELYRGVVPIRFGADALGGAVNLVTERRQGSGASGSIQAGSFGTYRHSLALRTEGGPGGLWSVGSLFLDRASNNYRIQVEVPDARGRLSPAEVTRFHDGYLAHGAALEVGVRDRRWARLLSLRGFATGFTKELQHNAVMTIPFGEARSGERVRGATVRYEQSLSPSWELSSLVGYHHRSLSFVDRSPWVYDWYGRRVRARRSPGELESRAIDQEQEQQGWLGRVNLRGSLGAHHSLHFNVSPSAATRYGKDHLTAGGPLTRPRGQWTLVGGVEHGWKPGSWALENVLFVKGYRYAVEGSETLPGGQLRSQNRSATTFGVGDALRYQGARWLSFKASYELTTRLPRPDEVFGNGVLIAPNLALDPERSHNGNLGSQIEVRGSSWGNFSADLGIFIRDSARQIVLLGNDRFFSYQNVYRAWTKGLELAATWGSPGHRVNLEGGATYQDQRNASTEGAFRAFRGDRIPNRPYFFGSWGARAKAEGILEGEDSIELFYLGRYVHDFFRGWESQGLRASKQVIPAQLSHTVGLTHTLRGDPGRISSTFEVQNLTDALLFDDFGVQRPGRAFFLKMTADLDQGL
jgi:hypothetical protein